ncbi:MAG: S1C family serine protease [Dehalococcoidia bacterium]
MTVWSKAVVAAFAIVVVLLSSCGGEEEPDREVEDLRATVESLQTASGQPTAVRSPTPPPTPASAACGLNKLAEASDAVVVVETPDGGGTAFFIENRHLLTNRHVVGGYSQVVIELADGTRLQAAVVSLSETLDLAVLRVSEDAPRVLVWGSTNDLQAGQDVFAVGYPFDARGQPVVTKGIVSRVGVSGGEALVQTDAALNPGNSGGPLLTACGQVVGVNTRKLKGSEGFGIAIAQADAQPEAELLVQGTAGRQPAPDLVTFDDPFEFCQNVSTIDWPVHLQPEGAGYVGNPSPFGSAEQAIAWRCWDGKVLGCYAGASGGACMKINASTEPPAELVSWCQANPDSFPPLAATGHNNAFEWACAGQRPVITKRLIQPEQIDGLGYFLGTWFLITP